MEGILVASLFWNEVFNVTPKVVPTPPTTTEKPYNREEVKPKRRDYRGGLRSFSKPTTVIVAPHPDDEILCCSNKITEKLTSGERVKIIFITNGDGKEKVSFQEAKLYGEQRKNESRTTAQILGLQDSDLYFLGFPDGELKTLEVQGQVRSRFTNLQASTVGNYFVGSPYTKEALKRDVTALLNRLNPEEIILPSEEDTHSDHAVTARIVKEVLAEKHNYKPEVLEYLVHSKKFSKTEKTKLDLAKLKLIHIFKTQFHDIYHKDFMEQWAWVEEQFENVSEQVVQQ
ncbi:PIG-L family deacetylase [Candidatus Gracilibacteria bacterium]|nr:PIG-L family deacetylase [Candidatus Gracilibacteria bacterium]